jgi:hypothetical protein
MSELDQEFEKTAEQINAKIKEAAEALKQANELATQAGLSTLIYSQFIRDNMEYDNRYAEPKLSRDEITEKCEELKSKLELIDVGPLEAELGDGGWNTSSSYC